LIDNKYNNKYNNTICNLKCYTNFRELKIEGSPFMTEMEKVCLDIEAEIDNLKIKVYCYPYYPDGISFHVKIITPLTSTPV
jgi:hypothetical protein